MVNARIFMHLFQVYWSLAVGNYCSAFIPCIFVRFSVVFSCGTCIFLVVLLLYN